jgi:hypothetical protein
MNNSSQATNQTVAVMWSLVLPYRVIPLINNKSFNTCYFIINSHSNNI